VTLTPPVRKLLLTTHITFSVGWLGTVLCFLALAIAGLTSEDAQLVRSCYVAMELLGWWVIVPTCAGALVTGVVQALGTEWGLFQHYWVVIKLLISVVATVILLVHMQPITQVARAAVARPLARADLRGTRTQLVADAGAAVVARLVTTTLSVYKPRGRTRYGQRVRQPRMADPVA